MVDIFGEVPELVTESQSWKKTNDEVAQNTVKWFLHRWDKFTGSEIPDLMKQGRGKDNMWGETAKGVILKKVAYARMTDEGREQQAEIEMRKDFAQTRWGHTYEPEARKVYSRVTGLTVNEIGFMTNPKMPFNGGSFDGDVVDDNDNRIGIIEIKCPYDPVKHDKNSSLSIDGLDEKHEYYGQIQNNINVAGVDWCDFISYDPRRKDEFKMVVIRVERDPFYIESIVDRITKAEQIKNWVLGGMSINQACWEVER